MRVLALVLHDALNTPDARQAPDADARDGAHARLAAESARARWLLVANVSSMIGLRTNVQRVRQRDSLGAPELALPSTLKLRAFEELGETTLRRTSSLTQLRAAMAALDGGDMAALGALTDEAQDTPTTRP